ncbi:MAG: hypothetical protein KAI17_12850 [Thiotrichaceae bacterium]|nr:hypothetical protein [Thiotrichaceae bacterium]
MKRKITTFVVSPIAFTLMMGAGVLHASEYKLSPIEQLGEKIFLDENLSQERNQACVSCHDPKAGWTGGISKFNEHGAVYEGSIDGEFGNRKPPSSAYANFSPRFYADYGNRLIGEANQQNGGGNQQGNGGNQNPANKFPRFIGGNFWDGRATGWKLGNPAADQAQGPFLNPVEHALPNPGCAVQRVCESSYSELFDTVWSPNFCRAYLGNVCDDGMEVLSPQLRKKVSEAYDRIALSIAAFESSKASNAFTSRIDAHLAGKYEFTDEEIMGRDIFRGKGKCSTCHVGSKGPGNASPLMTNFSYSNLGVPRNPENPFSEANPDWQDPGLAGFLKTVPEFVDYAEINLGKVKVPTLRNVALGSCETSSDGKNNGSHHGSGNKNGHVNNCIIKAYMHNGYFKSLKSVVHFYNTRDLKDSCEELEEPVYDATEEQALNNNCWPKPEVSENVEMGNMGNLGLTEEEEDALVMWMDAMSDGYFKPEHK